jgi:hypothetical protein
MHSGTIVTVTCVLLVSFSLLPAQELAGSQLGFTVAEAPWILILPGNNLKLRVQEHKPDGKKGYVRLTNEMTGINISFFIEPAIRCKTSSSCRDMVWRANRPTLEDPQNVLKSEIDDVSVFEYFLPAVKGVPVRLHNMYAEFVVDGYWVDLHISKGLYKPDDRRLFEDVVRSITFKEKGENAQSQRTIRRYGIPKLGHLEMSVPVQWQENFMPLEDPPLLNLAYFLPSTGDFYMKITAAWAPQEADSLPDSASIRRTVEETGKSALEMSIEKKLRLHEIRGPAAAGFYFKVTDKQDELPPEEFKYMTQGAAVVDGLTVIFTSFSNLKDMPAVSDSIEIIESARFKRDG